MDEREIEALRASGRRMSDPKPAITVPADAEEWQPTAAQPAPIPAARTGQQETTPPSLGTRLLLACTVLLIAVLACIPHWLGPLLAAMTSFVGLPIAWGMRRVTTGPANRLTITITVCFAVTLALAIIAPVLWWQVGTLTLPDFSE